MAKKRQTRRSILDIRIGNFPLLVPFIFILIGLYVLLNIIMMHELRTWGSYDHAKYQRYTQFLEAKEVTAFNDLSLPRPITEQRKDTGAYTCYFSAAGFGVLASSDECFTGYTAVMGSVPSVDDFNKLLVDHGWNTLDPHALDRYRNELGKPSNPNNPPVIIYYRPEPGIKLRVEVIKCSRTTTECKVAEPLFSNDPMLSELYEVRVNANVESDAIQKWGG